MELLYADHQYISTINTDDNEYMIDHYLPSLELFWSPYCPYSHLILDRIFLLVEKYNIDLIIKYVNHNNIIMSQIKKNIIFVDSIRESHFHGVKFAYYLNFSNNIDKIWPLLMYAKEIKKQKEFI